MRRNARLAELSPDEWHERLTRHSPKGAVGGAEWFDEDAACLILSWLATALAYAKAEAQERGQLKANKQTLLVGLDNIYNDAGAALSSVEGLL